MEQQQYLEAVKKKLEANFTIEAPAVEEGESFLMVARYHNISGRIFITPKDIIDKYETFETCYIKGIDCPTLDDVEYCYQLMCEKASGLQPGKEHFYTDITGVLVSKALPKGIEKSLRKLNYEKTYRLFWRGFSKVRLVCVDLDSKQVFTNKAGKEIKKVYQW